MKLYPIYKITIKYFDKNKKCEVHENKLYENIAQVILSLSSRVCNLRKHKIYYISVKLINEMTLEKEDYEFRNTGEL